MVLSRPFHKLILIVVLGAILRFGYLTSLPPSLNWDEVSHAYSAYSLLKTGKDQWGSIMPLFNFRAYGDYPTTLNLYGTVPFVAFFGPQDWSARAPHALIGVLAIVVSFGAGYWWKRSINLGLLTALLVAIDPWTVFSSRAVFQSNWTIMLLSLFLALFLRTKVKKTGWGWGFLALSLSLFSYHNARILVPLLSGWIFLTNRARVVRMWCLVVISLSLVILLSPDSRARGGWVGIVDQGAVAAIEQQRISSHYSPVITKLLYNRPVYFVTRFVKNYIGYFSPQFLFTQGGSQYQFSLPQFGVLHEPNGIFFYLGLLLLFLVSPLIIIFLLLSPIPAALTGDQFAVIRATTMVPLVQMTTALGLSWIYFKIHPFFRKLALIIYFVFLGISLFLWGKAYLTTYAKGYSSSWQYGHAQVVEFVKDNWEKYDQVVFTKRYGEPHEFVLWYWPWNPANYHPDWDYHDNWYWVNGFDKFVFINDWELIEYVKETRGMSKRLIVASPENRPSDNVVKTIYFLDGRSAFELIEE